MKNLLLFAAFSISMLIPSLSYGQEVEPERPKIIREVVIPDLYDVKIILDSGEVIEIQRVAMTKRGLEKQLSFRMIFGYNKMRIIDEDGKIREIKLIELAKIEITKVKDKPKPVTPVPLVKKPGCN